MQRLHRDTVLVTDQRDHGPGGTGGRSGPTGADSPWTQRGVEVDDAEHRVDVDTPRRHVGGDEGLDGIGGKGSQRALTLGLRTAAVNRRRGDTAGAELAGQSIGAVTGPAEDDRASVAGNGGGRELDAVAPRRPPEEMVDLGVVVADVHDMTAGLALVSADENVDVAVERGREQQRLAV